MRRLKSKFKCSNHFAIKEISNMPPRLSRLSLSFAFLILGTCAIFVTPASATPAPWWQVLTSSRPTNLWEPTDNVQKLTIAPGPFGPAIEVKFKGETVACLGSGLAGSVLCPVPAIQTAAQLEAVLEAVLETSTVSVTGGPVGTEPFVITTPGRAVPTLGVSPVNGISGSARVETLSAGGSGSLVITLTNLGDARVDATSNPVRITDQLPTGIIATASEAHAGATGAPLECEVASSSKVACVFEGELAPFEAIEVEIYASLNGESPGPVPPGEVTVTGGNAPSASAVQGIKVSPVPAQFGIESFSAQAEEEGGGPALQAGRHPFQFTTTIQLNSASMPRGRESLEVPALARNFRFSLPAGLVGNARVAPQCPMETFLEPTGDLINECSDDSAIGVTSVTILEKVHVGLSRLAVPVFNLPPGRGEPARLGFMVVGNPVVIDTEVDPDNHYRVIAAVRNTTQLAKFLASTLTLWGVPGDSRHDASRGWSCDPYAPEGTGPCRRPSALQEAAFLRVPVSCDAPLDFGAETEPWNVPIGSKVERASFTGDPLVGCNRVPFNPTVKATPASRLAESASGLDFELKMPNSGLLDGEAVAEGQAKKVEVTLPEGVTVNPSQANGLGVCTPQEYAQETFESGPGDGCPESSKVGEVDISTPLLEEEAHGAVYVAAPYDNPFNSLLGLYVVAKIPSRGILVKQAGKVDLNPETGQVVTTFDDLPQIPFSTFDLQFTDGDRAPLVMPSSCGEYVITTNFTPWNAADPNNPQPDEIVTRTSSFTVDQGPNGGACPSGTPPFKPGFTAGTENNAAGKYSPLDVRLTRQDGEQELSTFSLKMPKGVLGKLAGIPFCPDAAIAAARSRTGPNGGREELEHPSCPDPSQIGRTLVGVGVGPTLTYAPGKLYLAGPYKGAKLSVVAITTAKVGPFDLGTVVIRQGLTLDPDTAQVSTDGSSGDPIPHILQGIVVHARDIRIYVDRKNFVLNPTSCERMTVSASVLGSGLAFGSSANGRSVDVTAPFQAADCASLGFKPKLALRLTGGVGRRAHPRLKAVLRARKGDANISAAVVRLPHSEFLDQGHIRMICTQVQFAAGTGNGSQCPKGSVYGRARAISPLLGEPLVGPVYLRSSSHALPDLVAALHSKEVDINLDGRIDSVDGGIRNTFEAVPDAPVTKFVLEMQGGRKGLLQNSTNICRGKHGVRVRMEGHNGKLHNFVTPLRAKCPRKRR